MLPNRYSNKRPVENWIVMKTGQAFYNTAGATNNIINSGNVVLADGQIGVFDATGWGTDAINVAISNNAATIAKNPAIYIAQGTEHSAALANATAAYPLWPRPFERTASINGRAPMSVVKRTYQAPTLSTWVLGQPTGSTGEIEALDNTEYQIRVAFRGRREDEFYNASGTATTNVSYLTPNYTTLGTAEPVDHLIQNLVWNLNRNSRVIAFDRTRFRGKAPFVAFAVSDAGGTGTVIDNGAGTAIDAGEFVPVVNTNIGVRGITVTAEQAAAIKAAATGAGLSTSATILTVDLATAGTATGGVADMIILMALDAELAYEDRIPQVKTRLDVGLSAGFDYDVVYHTEEVKAFEGSGSGRLLDLRYKATQGQRKYNLDHTEDPVIEFASPVVTTETYVIYNFEHTDSRQIDTTNVIESPKNEIVLIPSADTTAITAFDTCINAWLTSANGSVIETI